MRITFFLLLSFTLLSSCKKEKPAGSPKSFISLKHDMNYGGQLISMDTTSLDVLKFDVSTTLWVKYIDMAVWVKGPSISQIETHDSIVVIGFGKAIEYGFDELDENSEAPPLNAARLASEINSNPPSFHVTFYEGGAGFSFTGGSAFDMVNPVINAVPVTSQTIRIYGSVDTLSYEEGNGVEKHIADFHFDYTFPIQQ